MSSLRNAVQRRNHRERAQPEERQKWGLLEKRKDYKLRAADHKAKQKQLKALREKAQDRNEDEFYFGMMSSQTKGGVKIGKRGPQNSGGGGKVLDNDTVKLMKTQDVGYLRTVLQQAKKQRERLQEEVATGEVGVKINVATPGRRRTVFGRDGENVIPPTPRRIEVDGAAVPQYEAVGESKDNDVDQESDQIKLRHGTTRRRLQEAQTRERDLSAALLEVEDQRARMNGDIGGVNKNGIRYKIRRRKR